jgi:hypothetical protein
MRFLETFVANNVFKLLGKLWSNKFPLRAASNIIIMATHSLHFTSPSSDIEYLLSGWDFRFHNDEYEDDCLLQLFSQFIKLLIHR